MEKQLAKLKLRLQEINDINSAVSVLSWDQSTYMPPGGAAARGRQMAALGKIAHEKFVDPAIGKLIESLEKTADSLDPDSDDARLIKVTRLDYDQATKIPADLLANFQVHSAKAYQAWAAARPKNDFAAVQDNLKKTLDFSRQIADCFPGYDHIADPLIDFSDEGMKAESVRKLFAELRAKLVPLVQAIIAQEAPDDSCLYKSYPEDKQLNFATEIIKQYGYSFERGRQDKTHHPFMTKFSLNDVRITTRTNENDLGEALFSCLHEAGHALYELGIDQSYEGTPLANGTSAGIHESQSRLWENQVGRGRPFWEHYYPQLQKTFPDQLGSISLDTFYRAINKVQRSLIRTDADEVTYNLHVMIRFDLELELLEGNLAVADLPEAWHARYESDLGMRAPSDVNGVLQDVHWYSGLIGGSFQGYTLGNVMSALFFSEALKAHPNIPDQIQAGQFDMLRNWLGDNVYKYGRKYTADELIEQVTGAPLTIEPYIAYLKEKFGELYTL